MSIERFAVLLLCVFLAGCGGMPPSEPVAPLAAPPPVPPPHIVSFTVEPGSIKAGASATLRWETQGALAADLDPGFGVVELAGSRQVEPRKTTVYRLTAHGGGRTVTADVAVVVSP